MNRRTVVIAIGATVLLTIVLFGLMLAMIPAGGA